MFRKKRPNEIANIVFRAKHIKGKTNVIADYLSRSQFQKARALAPWLAPHQTAIPDHLLHMIFPFFK
jgi:hypothetical protein